MQNGALMRRWFSLFTVILFATGTARAEVGGASVIADPSLARGDWPERVSLAIPPAARGTAPEVALVASHRVTQSDVGAGWQLLATSAIRRRSASGGVPATTSDLSESMFFADGAELVSVSGPGTAHYQPETYDGSRFDYDASTNTWTRRRDGWTWTYGSTGSTRRSIATFPAPLPACAAPCNTESWFLASTVDPFGNRIDFTYEVSAMPSELTPLYGGATSSRDYQVKTITYAAGTAVVTFTYDTRPDVTVDLSGGFPVVHHRRLTRLESTAGGQLYSKYVLQYEDEHGSSSLLGTLTDCDNATAAAPTETPRRSLLRKLFRTSANGATKTLVRCNRYHHEGIAWQGSVDLSTLIADPFTNLEAIEDTWTPVPVEIDGDGRTDLILLAYSDDSGWEQTHHKVYISTPKRAQAFAGAGGGGDAGVYAADWEAELDATLGEIVFGNRYGRAITDVTGDAHPEILVEDGTGVKIRRAQANNGSSGGVASVTFSDLANDLDACDLRFGELVDVDGDRRPDVVVRAHGANGSCPAVAESKWIKNLGASPWFDSGDRRDLWVPIELATPAEWDAALAACPGGAVVPPSDFNPDWSIEGYVADQMRFTDFNDDGNVDVGVALYACWQVVDNRWRPILDSAYSRIWWGNGKGGFVDSGLSAGPPVLLDPLDWGALATDFTRIVPGTLSAIDFDRDGRSELLQSTYEGPDRFGYGWATCPSVLPSSGGYGVAADALLSAHEITVANSAWDCSELARTTGWGDFDGDGFLDLIGVHGQPGWWWAGISYSTRSISEGRLLETDNEHGGRTRLTWGWSALSPNTNPELPINIEVLQAVAGPGGTRSISYHDGAMRGDRVMPFGEVSVTNDRGGVEVYSFTISSWGGPKPQYLGVRYRENGSVEHVTVLIHGEYIPGIGFFVDTSAPFFNPLLRRCEFDIGQHAANFDALEDRCRELAWLAPSVPQTGGYSGGDGIQVTDDNWDLLVGRRRQPRTIAERALMPKLWRTLGGRDASPSSSRMVGGSLAQTLESIAGGATPILSNDYYRWPVPWSLMGRIPDVEASEAAYAYPNLLMLGEPDGYAWDFGYDHPLHQLVTRYEHRDLSTPDDDRYVVYAWERPPAPAVGVVGDWWRSRRETMFDRFGARLTQIERSSFVGFDSPTRVDTCGRASPADCASDRYEYFPNGTLKKHTFPDLTTEAWTRLAWCGEPLTYTDATGQVTQYTRSSGGDTRCLTQIYKRNGATWTYTHDDLLRPKKLVIAPGAGVTSLAAVTRTFYYDDALTFQSAVEAREDSTYSEPRRAERRGDGQLELIHADGLGRETKRVRCADTGTNTTGGDIALVGCSAGTERVLAWNLFGTDGNLKVTTGPFEGSETPTTTGYGHDGQGRRIVVLEPAHDAGTIGWRLDTLRYGAGYVERVEPSDTGSVASRRDESTLGESLTVAGVARGSLTRGLLGEITSVTAIDGSITRLTYDGRWLLQSELRVDATGAPVRASVVLPDGTTALRRFEHTITARDARGRMLEEVMPDDTVLGYAYDGLDRVTRRDVNGVPIRSYAYLPATVSAMGTVRVVDELGGSAAVSQLDGLGRVWTETAPRVSNRATYDTTGRRTSTTDIHDLTSSFYYDIHDDLTYITDARTGTTSFDRDGAGRVVRRTDADGVVETLSYTYSGLPYRSYRGPYLLSEQTYDPRGLVTYASEDGVELALTYDELGRLTKRREGIDGAQELRVTTYFYDAGDRVIETRRSPVAGLQTGTSYTHHDAWGRAYETVDALGHTTSFAFDAAGRVRRVRDAEGAVLETIYDDLGRVTDRQVPGGGWEHVRYHGRQTYGTEPNLWRIELYDDEDAARGVKTQRFVDGSGYLLAELRRDDTWVQYLRPTGRIDREELYDATGALFRATDHAYDPATGALVSTTRGPYTVAYAYTAAGRLAQTITPDDTLERHYEHGLLSSVVEAGVTHRYGRSPQTGWVVTEQVQIGSGAIRAAEIGRDRLGRIARVTWNDGSGPETVQTFSLFDYYDNPWLEVNQWGPGGAFTVVEASTFDANGRPLSRHTSGAGLPGHLIQWSWYDNGVLASVTTPASHTIAYDYGPTFDHQLDAVRLDGALVASVTGRDLRGALTQLAMAAAGQVRTTAYDDAGRPLLRTTGPTLPNVQYAWSAIYNPDGTLASETIDDIVGATSWTNEYTYDAAGRLTGELAGKTATTYSYTLDAAGNRTVTEAVPAAGPATSTTAQYVGPKLVQVGTTALAYNPWNEVSTDHHGNAYGRSADGRVTLIATAGTATAFARNARGTPVAALEPGPATRRTTWGLTAEGMPVEVTEAGGDVLTYIAVDGQHVATAVNGAVAPVDADPRTSPVRIGGTTLGAATAFGAGTTAPTGSDERFLYAMLERVPTASEIMLARHRTYDPTIGRFLEPDPIGSDGGLELYQYGHGDPVNFVDPLGHAEIGSVCSASAPVIGFSKIEPMTPQTLDADIPPSIFDEIAQDSAAAEAYRNSPFASFKIDLENPQYPPDFPIPTGPMCVVNCMGKLGGGGKEGGAPTTGGGSGGGPESGTPPPQAPPPPPPPPSPSEPPEPKHKSPFTAIGDAVKDFIEKLFGSKGGGDGESGETWAERLRSAPSRALRTIHQNTPGTLAREALAKEALDRGTDFVGNLRDAPSNAMDAARQLGNQFANDPVGTSYTIGRDIAVEMVVGTVRDAVEGAGEYGSGLRDAPGAVYRLYTADSPEEARDAAGDLLDAGGNLASGTYKLTGPITTVVGVGVAARGGQTAVKTAKKVYRGGAHRFTKKPVGDGLDSHHMPAKAASRHKIDPDDGPAIQMEPSDHRKTSSYGDKPSKPGYSQGIKDLIDAGRMRDAMAKEIRDVRRVTRETRGTRRYYEDAIFEMLDYAKGQGYLDKPSSGPATP